MSIRSIGAGGDSESADIAADVAQPTSRRTATTRSTKRTDIGTFVLHWITVVSFFTSLATGLRIAADAPDAVISRALDPILPQGEIWTVHFIASVALCFSAIAYTFYVSRAGLARRNALKRLVVFTLPTAEKLRWAAVNVALHWVLFLLMVVLAVSGVFLYIGYGGWLVTVHTLSAFGSVIYLLAHIFSHTKYGGLTGLVRIFLPKRLVVTKAAGAYALPLAILAGAAAALGAVLLDFSTRPVLKVAEVGQAPVLDGKLTDPAWSRAEPVTMVTQQGTGLDGTGQSTVEMRAVRQNDRITFAFSWDDSTHSLWRQPLVKKADGWHVLQDRAAVSDVITFYEDKFAVAFAHSNAFGGGDSTHMGSRPLAGKPAAAHGRGLHYTTDNSIIDVWQWKSSRGGMLGHADDMHFGPPTEPNAAQRAGKARYTAGYAADPGKAIYQYNYKTDPERGYDGPVGVLRLPSDMTQVQKAMGSFILDSNTSVEPGSQWWLTDRDSIPYSAERDASIPQGSVIPGVYISGEYIGDRADVSAGANWQDGRWTIELSRDLSTDSDFDIDFNDDRDIYLWVNVFDHNQTRHTRHARPITLSFRSSTKPE